jgi:hypothetical protein
MNENFPAVDLVLVETFIVVVVAAVITAVIIAAVE